MGAAAGEAGEAGQVGVALLRDVCARFQEACRRADEAGGAAPPTHSPPWPVDVLPY